MLPLFMEGFVEVLGVSSHVRIALDVHNAVFELEGGLFGSSIQAQLRVAATDIDFRDMENAKFIAHTEIEIDFTFVEQFRSALSSLASAALSGMEFMAHTAPMLPMLPFSPLLQFPQRSLGHHEGYETKHCWRNELLRASRNHAVQLLRLWAYIEFDRDVGASIEFSLQLMVNGKEECSRTVRIRVEDIKKGVSHTAKVLAKKVLALGRTMCKVAPSRLAAKSVEWKCCAQTTTGMDDRQTTAV